MQVGRVAVIGGGIAGLAAAHELTCVMDVETVLYEASDRVGGKIESTTFAGVEGLDSGADAFLARVPDAVTLATTVGLELRSPEPVGAAVWYDGMHDVPDGLLLGVPGRLAPLARTRLLSPRGKARAAIEPLLPRTPTDSDSIGEFVRARFGDEVHERLVDALVGSIYAADTDRFSLAEVPQLDALASSSRSILLAARRQRAAQGTATAVASPVFATPVGGVQGLTDALASELAVRGADLRLNEPVAELASVTDRLGRRAVIVDGEQFDAVVLAAPASDASKVLASLSPSASARLAEATTADVAIVTLHVGADEWPRSMRGRSGYLVPKPVQRSVTAASFGSQKWAHWRPPAGGEILRVSLGRDGLPVLHLDDDELLDATLRDLQRHLGVELAPLAHRVSRWPGAFAQYRPHHRDWVTAVEAELPPEIALAGASYRGIGIPACIREGRAAAARVGGSTDTR